MRRSAVSAGASQRAGFIHHGMGTAVCLAEVEAIAA